VRFTDLARLVALISRIARPASAAASDPRVVEQLDLRTADIDYDRYDPHGEPRAIVVVLHGVVLAGRRDPRLVHFGRSLARSGVTCLVPTLPGLARCRWEVRDLDAIASVVNTVDAGRRVGLIGFCYAASYALVAAARPALAPRISFVLGFGPYHSLPTAFDTYVAAKDHTPSGDKEWDNWIYLHLVMAHQHLPEGEVRAAACELLDRYCLRSSSEEKRAFFDRHLRHAGLLDATDRARDEATLEALSPAGKLGPLQATVSLLHDPRDTIVPAFHSERIFAELQALPGAERHRLLVTTLLSHAELSNLLRPGELLRFCSALEPVVRAS
jgi:hypothetical protein